MIRIINNTDIADSRLIKMYAKELSTLQSGLIECIVFDACRMTVFGVDCLLLEVSE